MGVALPEGESAAGLGADANENRELSSSFPAASAEEEQGSSLRSLALAFLLGLLIAGAAGILWTRPSLFANRGIALQIIDVGSDIHVVWEPTDPIFRAATGGVLEVRDGESAPAYLPVTRDGLKRGLMVYPARSDKIDVRFALLDGSKSAGESRLYVVVNPARSAAVPAVSAFPEPETPVTPAARSESLAQEAMPPPRQAQQRIPLSTDDAPARVRLVVRSFNPPAKESSSRASELPTQGNTKLPDVPEIHAAQTAVPMVLPNANPIRMQPPPTPVRPQAIASTQPRSGRLIWTGDLRKNGLLALSATGASSGVLNGRLPGFPVKVRVEPGELMSGGIAIFSSDATKSGRTESPSADNGWNVVLYKWDPRRAAEVGIMEAPSPANHWQQLVLRTGDHNSSVLVVDWTESGQ